MRVVVAALAALFLIVPALAQEPPVSIFAGRLRPSLGYCRLNVDTAKSLTSCAGGVPAGSFTADIIIETQGVRYRTDGTAPTSSVGMLIPAGGEKVFTLTDLTQIQLIAQTAGAVVNVEFYGP